jgi:hypothetical protein
VATLTSTSLDLNPSYNQIVSQYAQPNWLQYKKYGTSFEMTLEKVQFDENDGTTMNTIWASNFPINVDANGDKPDVFLGGMILKQSPTNTPILIVAGSTRGMGNGYGSADGNDEDGYISVIDPNSGALVNDGSTKNNVRIGTAEDDIIAGICDDPNDPNSFYVVGATKGSMGTMDESPPTGSLAAYIQKINLSTLSEVWTVQWGAINSAGGTAITTAFAIDCIVTSDGMVYVAGVVQNGASIGQQSSKGGDDIFVAQLMTSSGTMNWMQQLGSSGNEWLARGDGLALDLQQNLVVFGDTDGNFFRFRDSTDSGTSDVFLVTMNKSDGSYPPTGSAMDTVPTPAPAGSDGVAPSPTPPAGGPGSGGVLDSTLGVQSGPSAGPLFPGGMIYDPVEEMVYMTGITYDMDFDGNTEILPQASCFIASASLDDGEVWDWEDSKTYGDTDFLEACNTIALHRISELVAVGSADQGSILLANNNLGNLGQMAGFALAVDRGTLGVIDSTPIVTTDPTNRFEYPITVVSDGSDLYIVSLTSTDSQASAEFSEINASTAGARVPNWINIQKYGSSLDMTVTKLTLSEELIDGLPEGRIQFTTVWSKEFPIDVDPNTGTKPRVYIGGAIIKENPGFLAVAGSTRGLGDGYGDAEGDDEDGFITLFDLSTGELASNVQSSNIREGSAEDDGIAGICHDPNDSSSFYVVGSTFGVVGDNLSQLPLVDGSMSAWIRKISASDLSPVWTKQLGAVKSAPSDPSTVYALGCAVSGDFVYAGGVVDDNAGIVLGTDARLSSGGDDIWLGQFSSDTGGVNWLHQVGTPGDDHMAPRGGVIVASNGNAIVYGDTNGSAFRSRDSEGTNPDLIVMSFDASDGSYPDMNMDNIPASTPLPTIPPVPVPVPGVPPQPTAVFPVPVPLGSKDQEWNTSSSSSGMPPAAIAFLVIGILLIVGIIGWFLFCRRRGRRAKRRTSLEERVHTLEMAERSDLAKKDGIFSVVGNGNGYHDDPLGSPNISAGGYSDLQNKGKEVI